MKRRYRVNVMPSDGYRFRLLGSRDSCDFSFTIDEINFYINRTEEERIFIISDSKLVYDLEGLGAAEFQVGFKGWIELDLSASDEELFGSSKREVDYNIEIFVGNEMLEQDNDYELVYNKRVIIRWIKP